MVGGLQVAGSKEQIETSSPLKGYQFSEESLASGFISDQRVFVPKRIAVLWSEMPDHGPA